MARGKLITIEGIEGVGKSTARDFIHAELVRRGMPVIVTREPGGTEIAEKIRNMLLAHHDEPMAPDTELLLMFAARAQHIAQLIRPHLAAGDWVLCDRFVDASYAYQGGGRGIEISRIDMLAKWTLTDLTPDYTFLLDAPVDVALQRVCKRGQLDRIESEKQSFFMRVKEAYLARAQADPVRYIMIDAAQVLAEVQIQLKNRIEAIVDGVA